MIGAARLDVHTFEEVENDSTATSQALMVVVLVSIASAIGFVLASAIFGVGGVGNLVSSLIFGVIRGVAVWAVWALLTYILGTTLFKTPDTHADWSQLARTTGFAQAPGVFQVLVFIPAIGWLIALISSLWQLVAMVIAVRQALDYKDTLRAVGVVVVGFIIIFVLLAILGGLFGIAAFRGFPR
jgi:hypothetical protein